MNNLDTLRPEVRSALGAMVRADVCRDSVPTEAFDTIRAELVRLEDECAMHRKFMWMLLKAAGGSICVQPSVAVSFNPKTAVLDRIPEINGSVTFRASTSTPGKHND